MKCKICNHISKNSRGRNTHLRFKHPEITVGEYYEKYYSRFCKVCNELIKFKGEKYEQTIYCSKKCLIKDFSNHTPKNKGTQKYKKDFLLNLLRDLHKKYKGYITQKLVNENLDIKYQTYHNYFGSFINACELAGVPNLGKQGPRKHFKEDVIKIIKNIYDETQQKISYELIFKNSRLTKRAILQFYNSLGELCSENNIPYNLEDKQGNDIPTNMVSFIVDVREKRPYKFRFSVYDKLDVGDYRSKDFFNGVVFERKSIKDLKSTMSGGTNTKRFGKEMERARKNEWYVVIVIDGTKEDFFKSRTYGRVNNNSIYHNIKKFGSVYADVCQFVFTGSRRDSMKLIEFMFNWYPQDLLQINIQDLLDDVSKNGKI